MEELNRTHSTVSRPDTVGTSDESSVQVSSDEDSSQGLTSNQDTTLVVEIKTFLTLLQGPLDDIDQRIADFYRARQLRHRQFYPNPYGVFGFFMYIDGLRIDMEWAGDASWRRKTGNAFLSWTDFDHIYSRRFKIPYFCYILIMLCTAAFLVSMKLNDWRFEPMRVNPMLGPSVDVLLEMGALNSTRIVNENEWYRLFAPIILHAGVIHLLINSLALWYIGAAVEKIHGGVITAVIFLVSGTGGNIASALFWPNAVSVGASGGIFGLVGLCLADIMKNWDFICMTSKQDGSTTFPYVSTLIVLVSELSITLIIGFTPFVDNFAHLGGLVYGCCFGLALSQKIGISGFFGTNTLIRRREVAWRVLGIFIGAALLTWTTFLLLNEEEGEMACPSCRYISCLPFPFWVEDKWWTCDPCDMISAEITQLTNATEISLTCPFQPIENINVFVEIDANVGLGALRNLVRDLCHENCDV